MLHSFKTPLTLLKSTVRHEEERGKERKKKEKKQFCKTTFDSLKKFIIDFYNFKKIKKTVRYIFFLFIAYCQRETQLCTLVLKKHIHVNIYINIFFF